MNLVRNSWFKQIFTRKWPFEIEISRVRYRIEARYYGSSYSFLLWEIIYGLVIKMFISQKKNSNPELENNIWTQKKINKKKTNSIQFY